MIKSLHGREYYFEVANEEEAKIMRKEALKDETFAKNFIEVDYYWDGKTKQIFLRPVKVKPKSYKELIFVGELRGETYRSWEKLKSKYYRMKRNGKL